MVEPDRVTPTHALRLAEWLDARLDGVDGELAARIRSAIDDVAPEATILDAPRALVDAAAARLAPLAASGCTARESAADLLAVDALATLACEALADSCTTAYEMEERATSMVRVIAATMPRRGGAA